MPAIVLFNRPDDIIGLKEEAMATPDSHCDDGMTARKAEYQAQAKERFNSLLSQTDVDFWKVANAFDTMIDYVTYCSQDATGDAGKAAKWVIDAFPPDTTNMWFDDFGWWSIATGRAAQMPIFNPNNPELLALAEKCWLAFTDRAPKVWAHRTTTTFDDCEPAIPGGVWNGYWQGTSDKWPGPKTGDPNSGTLLGIQNTVTNAVYLLSAQVLKENDAAQQEFGFLDTWLNLPGAQVPLLWTLDLNGTQALVRERATHYLRKAAPGFQREWAWTGDQGLIIGALVSQVMRPDTPPDKELVRTAVKLVHGAVAALVQNNTLNYWTRTGRPPSVNSNPKANWDDYSTGSGVFWRYMLRVWATNDPNQYLRSLKAVLGTLNATLTSGADQAMIDPAKRQTWPNGYRPDADWVRLTNDLAVLVAAYKMLP